MRQKRDTWLYQLKQGHEIVYFGISTDPERRAMEHCNSGKRFNGIRIVSPALTRASAEVREGDEIRRYQRQHGGSPPRYNADKTY